MEPSLSDAWRGDTRMLLGLRWLGGIGMLAGTMASAAGMPPGWDLLPSMLLTGLVLLSNLGLLKLQAQARIYGPVLLADLGVVTGLLAMSGGAGTPYSFVYTFPVVAGALLLPARQAWGLLAAAVVAYLSLFWLAPAELHHHGPEAMKSHLIGMLVGFTVTALVVTAAVTGVRQAREEAEAQLAEARERAERSRRVSALATLAAGAAHELATPLSTILLVSRELREELPDQHEDLELIAEEVLRCQGVLRQLSMDSGQGMGEVWSEQDLRALVAEAVPSVDNRAEGLALLPARLVQQVLRRLVGNAREAGAETVTVRSELGEQTLLEVRDDGPGMAPELLARATEPFFSGRPQGRGLGLYFCASVAQELGGRLELESTPGQGTTARLLLPARGPHAS